MAYLVLARLPLLLRWRQIQRYSPFSMMVSCGLAWDRTPIFWVNWPVGEPFCRLRHPRWRMSIAVVPGGGRCEPLLVVAVCCSLLMMPGAQKMLSPSNWEVCNVPTC